MPYRRARLAALLTAALLGGGVLAAAAPAEARTWDDDPVRDTIRFSVAGRPWTLLDESVGRARQTIQVGQHSGAVWSDYRLTFRDASGHTVVRVHRHLARRTLVVERFEDASFPTIDAFRRAKHRALAVDPAIAKAHFRKGLRIESVQADLETEIGRVLDHLDALPAGAAPDFTAVSTAHSGVYRGSITVSGTDSRHWSVIVRDEQDGYGEFYDAATGSGSDFRL